MAQAIDTLLLEERRVSASSGSRPMRDTTTLADPAIVEEIREQELADRAEE